MSKTTRRARKIKRRKLQEANNRCVYCQCLLTFESATIDHVIPRSRGSSNFLENKVVA